MSAKTMEEIAIWLQELRFRKRKLGGVDEEDVWKKLEQLHGEYLSAFDAQKERFSALIEERNAEIRRLRGELKRLSGGRGE